MAIDIRIKAPEPRLQGSSAVISHKSPHERLYKGTDARVRAFRNNLVRKLPEVLQDIKDLDEKYINELMVYMPPDDLVAAAVAYRDTLMVRVKATQPKPAKK